MSKEFIRIGGAREHNLKNLTLTIPRNKLVVVTGVPIVAQTTSDIVDKILALPPRSRVMVLAPVVRDQKGEFRDVIERLAREGFVRARVDGELMELEGNLRIKLEPKQRHTIEAV